MIDNVIRQMRDECGMTREQFAERVGCSVTAVKNWEMGISRPTNRYMYMIAEAFGVPLEKLKGARDEGT